MQTSARIDQLFEWLMPMIEQPVFMADLETLLVLNASKGALALAPSVATSRRTTLTSLLDNANAQRLDKFLAAYHKRADTLITNPEKATAWSKAEPLSFRYMVLAEHEKPLLLAIGEPKHAISQREMHYQAIVSHLPALIFQMQLKDNEGISFTYLSDGCENLLEITPDALLLNPALFLERLIPEDRAAFLEALFASAEDLQPINWEGRFRSEKFQDVKWVNLRSTPVKLSARLLQWDGIMNNITQSKRERLQIEESHRMLTELTREMEKVKELERLRIAREVHDDLGGNLTAIKIGLGSLLKKLDQSQPGTVEKIQHLDSIIDQTFEAIHRIASDLRPDVLELGIVDGLVWLAREFEKRMGITCHFRANRQRRLSPDQEITLFRVCQEALSNVAKHAKASETQVELVFERDMAIMSVSDNGVGIRAHDLLKPSAYGLKGMAERMAAVGGQFEIKPAGERGTMKIFKLPLH